MALTFRLYMMRYGIAMLAASRTHHGRAGFAEDIAGDLESFLTRKTSVPTDRAAAFREYLFNKPGSPRYTPIRRALQDGRSISVEQQDVLLSDNRLSSSVGALTQDYFDDALGLAHTLKLVKKEQNLLLARGRLSLSSGWEANDPFFIGDRDALYLGLWLLDVDCDWIWAFIRQLPGDTDFEITAKNRVQLLLESWRFLLAARGIRPQPETAMVRTRLNELLRITERNVDEKLNLGQPWSWFLVPRLELLVDAGILSKRQRHGLSGYALTSVGRKMRSICLANQSGEELIARYFASRDSQDRPVVAEIDWRAIREELDSVTGAVATSVGYLPIFETAAALCVAHFLERRNSGEPLWEIDGIEASLRRESKAPGSNVRLGIDRQGRVYAFRIKDV